MISDLQTEKLLSGSETNREAKFHEPVQWYHWHNPAGLLTLKLIFQWGLIFF